MNPPDRPSEFEGSPTHRNLKLFSTLNRYSDRLTTASLRIGRYPVERHLDPILERLWKARLMTAQENGQIAAVAEASGGKNLHLLRGLARRLRPDELP